MSAAGHVSALRGTAPALRSAEPDAGRARRTCCGRRARCCRSPRARRRRSWRWPRSARCTGWRCSSRPRPRRAWYALGAALLAMVGPARRRAAARRRALARPSPPSACVGARARAARPAASPTSCCGPTDWGELAAGISRGIGALPGARVPYRGIDQWTRLVIPLGGTVLVVARGARRVLAAARRASGFPLAALVLLVTLYAVPAVALDFEGEFLRGALLALLVLALPAARAAAARRRPAAAALLAVGVAVAGADRRARARRRPPWWDYETWALDTASSRSTTFTWDHDYGPLDWPRDGRELLRVQGQAARLLEGREPRRLRRRALARVARRHARGDRPRAPGRPGRPRALAPRRSASRSATCARARSSPPASRRRAGHAAAAPRSPTRRRRHLRRRAARCAAATPTGRRLHAAADRDASCARPAPDYDRDFDALPRRSSCSTAADADARRAGRRRPGHVVDFPALATRGAAPTRPAGDIGGGARSRSTAAALRSAPTSAHLGARAAAAGAAPTTPVDYVKAVEAYLGGDGFTYTETPPRRRATLDGLPVRRQDRLLPAVLGRDGAAAADGAASPRAWRPASPPARYDRKAQGVRRARPRRPLVGRGVVPGLSAGSRSTRRRPPRRRARSATTRGARGAAAATRRRPRRRRRARPARRRSRRDRAAHAVGARTIGGGVLAALLLGRLARAPSPPPRAAAPAPLLASSSARCARTRPRRRARARRCRRSRRVRPLARRRRATCARCASSATAAAATRRRAPSAAGLRSELGRGGGLARAPARVVGAAAEARSTGAPYTRSAHG